MISYCQIILQIYNTVNLFPKEELYGLTSQMKRSSISIASNIAEGNQRWGKKERLRFFDIAQGSLFELDSQLEIALALKFVSQINYERTLELINKVGYLLAHFIQTEINRTNPSHRTNLKK